jgi:putative PIN family toxin of toxin-antitoxin system
LKVVLDSSIWISALKFGGIPRQAAIKAVSQDQLVVCRYIELEVTNALEGKFGWTATEIERAFAAYWPSATWVSTTGAISGVCRDPADDAILECAVLANATLIVSGDHDLLDLQSYGAVRIITARKYVERADAVAQ